jgi:hypothetical protein
MKANYGEISTAKCLAFVYSVSMAGSPVFKLRIEQKCDHSDILVTIPSVFDEGDIREGLSGRGGHKAMIPSPPIFVTATY